YGYYWYGNQIAYTVQTMNPWLVFFVPESPTASLFFTLAIYYMIRARYSRKQSPSSFWQQFVEAFAVVTSIKYGVWAVAMIFACESQGDALVCQDWMLVIRHLGMALEAVLFAKYLKYGASAVIILALWTIRNDFVDYGLHVFP